MRIHGQSYPADVVVTWGCQLWGGQISNVDFSFYSGLTFINSSKTSLWRSLICSSFDREVAPLVAYLVPPSIQRYTLRGIPSFGVLSLPASLRQNPQDDPHQKLTAFHHYKPYPWPLLVCSTWLPLVKRLAKQYHMNVTIPS